MLQCGRDRLLEAVSRFMAVFAISLIAAGGLASEVKLLLAVGTLALLRARPSAAERAGILQVKPSGATFRGGIFGRILPEAWVSARYTVIRLEERGRSRPVLISASRQTRDDYRKLLACLRLGRWQGEG